MIHQPAVPLRIVNNFHAAPAEEDPFDSIFKIFNSK